MWFERIALLDVLFVSMVQFHREVSSLQGFHIRFVSSKSEQFTTLKILPCRRFPNPDNLQNTNAKLASQKPVFDSVHERIHGRDNNIRMRVDCVAQKKAEEQTITR